MEFVRMHNGGDNKRYADSSNRGKVQVKTASYTIQEWDQNGYIFSNRGAAGAVTFTLPTPKAGRIFHFLKATQQNLVIQATNGAKVAGSNANKAYQNTAAESGSQSVTIMADGTDWFLMASSGTWAVNNS